MALPVGVSINFAQWGFTPAAFSDYDIARNNISLALNLSLTGLANLLFADNAGTLDLGTTAQTQAVINAYERAPDPGPSNGDWRRALDQAQMLIGSSRFGRPFAASMRPEGRPIPITNAETAAL
jgi:hypothetical protein